MVEPKRELASIGVVENIREPDGRFNWYATPEAKAIERLQHEADVLLVEYKDGRKLWAAELNFLLGTCDDCPDGRFDRDVLRVEGFKVVES